jgi:hypothetical protein
MQVSRQAIYRTPRRRTDPGPRAVAGAVDEAIVAVARENPTDGTRMVAALTARQIGAPVNRKRTQRVMRQQKLLQRHRPLHLRRRPCPHNSRGHHYNRPLHQIEGYRQEGRMDIGRQWAEDLRATTLPLKHSFFL